MIYQIPKKRRKMGKLRSNLIILWTTKIKKMIKKAYKKIITTC